MQGERVDFVAVDFNLFIFVCRGSFDIDNFCNLICFDNICLIYEVVTLVSDVVDTINTCMGAFSCFAPLALFVGLSQFSLGTISTYHCMPRDNFCAMQLTSVAERFQLCLFMQVLMYYLISNDFLQYPAPSVLNNLLIFVLV